MRLITDDALAIATIMQEAESEPYEGKLAVAEVILRRTRRKYFSDGTVSGTVLAPIQFSGWNGKSTNRVRSVQIDMTDKIVLDCVRAWGEAQKGSNVSQGALLYYNPGAVTTKPEWDAPGRSTKVAEIGRHHFFVPLV